MANTADSAKDKATPRNLTWQRAGIASCTVERSYLRLERSQELSPNSSLTEHSKFVWNTFGVLQI